MTAIDTATRATTRAAPRPATRLRAGARAGWIAASLAVAAIVGAATTAAATTGAATTGMMAADPAKPVLVVCAPGYPGSTAEAQPAMDALAAAVSSAAGLKTGALGAVYFETEAAGLERLAQSDAALALVPLPFWLKHHAALGLDARLQAVEAGGEAAEAWTLVAGAGQVTGAAGLAGFELLSVAGYAPAFVKGPALGASGAPADLRITFSTAVLSGLRRASAGNKVALLLNRAQAASLATLPFAAKLQIVTKSAPMPVSVLSVVGTRISPEAAQALLKGFAALTSTPAGLDALAGVRMSRFVATDAAAIGRLRDRYDRAR